MIRKRAAVVWIPLLFGFLALNSTLTRPRMGDVHAVDIVSLLAAGACFGVALTGIVEMLRGRREPNR